MKASELVDKLYEIIDKKEDFDICFIDEHLGPIYIDTVELMLVDQGYIKIKGKIKKVENLAIVLGD